MAQPAHNRITFSGIFGPESGPLEVWSWGLKTTPTVFASDTTRQAAAALYRGLYVTRIQPLMAASVRLTRTRVSQHLEGGLTSQDEGGQYNQADDLTVVSGTNASTRVQPLQSAACVSLVTPRSGPSGKGRLFLPAVNYEPQAGSYVWSDTVTQAFADAIAQMITSINNDGSNTVVSVVSSKGFLSPVTSVRCGSVPDTMRSRRGNLLETYTTAAVTG